jgi:hypothetical protein
VTPDELRQAVTAVATAVRADDVLVEVAGVLYVLTSVEATTDGDLVLHVDRPVRRMR